MKSSSCLLKKLILFSAVVVFLVTIPMISYGKIYAHCEKECLKVCAGKDDAGHSDCMRVCMDKCLPKKPGGRDRPPPLKGDLDSFKACDEADTRVTGMPANLMLAAAVSAALSKG